MIEDREAADRESRIRDRQEDVQAQTLSHTSPSLGSRSPALETSSSTGLNSRTASALAYLAGPFSGALMLFIETIDQDVRFHAWQSTIGLGGLGVAVVLSYLLAFAALFVSATAVSVMLGVAGVLWIVLLLVWALCLWQALSGERWKLPLAGDYAERHMFTTRS
jgi:uncharacterized membrane protein